MEENEGEGGAGGGEGGTSQPPVVAAQGLILP